MPNLYKLLFMSTTIMGTMITISSYSWMGMWMGLEINLLSIIPLMNNSENVLSSESSLKYFITQVVASSTLLFSMIMLNSLESIMMNNFKPTMSMIMNSSLLMKMGAAPLHFWFPEIIEGLSWMNTLIMMTWQKIAPIMVLMNNIKEITLIISFIISSMLIGGIMSLNQTSARKILTYSSINHIGWMLSTLLINMTTWMNYFMIYSIITTILITTLKTMNINSMTQLFKIKNNTLKMTVMINFLSMGGVPPFLGFMPKWFTINYLIELNVTLSIIMVLITLITLFMYVRTMISSLTLQNTENKILTPWKKKSIIWISNWINLTALCLCSLWFNFT